MAKVIFGGKEWDSLRQLCKAFGSNYDTVRARLSKGYSLYDAIHKPYLRGHKFTRNGKLVDTKTVAKAAGIKPATVRKRLESGWTKEEAMLPLQKRMGLTAFNRTQTVTAWAKERNMTRTCLRNRLRSGMAPELALTLAVMPSRRRKAK